MKSDSLFQIAVKDKGRVVLPSGLRDAAGFKPGDILVADVVDKGTFIVRTRQALYDRLWDPATHSSDITESDNTEGAEALEVWRDQSQQARFGKLSETVEPVDHNEVGDRLVAYLGLS